LIDDRTRRPSLEPILVFLLLMIAAGLVGGMIATARRGSAASEKELTELRERMLRLEQSVEGMTADMERFSEGQRFLTALLEDRAKGQPVIKAPPATPPGD
jgi:hypothetical protein